ncbi:MAG: YqgE/AlgH family protein [Proteobacteria bacterium]|nr:YqgE/AlgH family protein [Pseudomonadota bacterium]MBU1715921.1 YqgE/AlgH family protein [Pseudomonadota bacterium]
MESLQGNFLIATSRMPDPRFQRQVIYLCAHSEDEGAMGLVVNHPSDHTLVEILRSVDMPVPDFPLPPIYYGGPVEMDAVFILFSADYEPKNYIEVVKNVRLSRDADILWDISRGIRPNHYLFFLGYAGWGPGQLENELAVNGWLTLPGDEEVLFEVPDARKWHESAIRHGIDISTFEDVIGSA